MQLAASWSVSIGHRWTLTMTGAPIGEAALGPVAFMHRAANADNPVAPLSHHIFDSTHTARSVVVGRLERGKVAVEVGTFHGREPDEHRYNLDGGVPDSWSTRLWFKPSPAWTVQASYGFLHQPEQLEPGDQRRANVSVSWFRLSDSGTGPSPPPSVRTHGPTAPSGPSCSRAAGNVVATRCTSGSSARTSRRKSCSFRRSCTCRTRASWWKSRVGADDGRGARNLSRVLGITVGLGADVTGYQVPPLLPDPVWRGAPHVVPRLPSPVAVGAGQAHVEHDDDEPRRHGGDGGALSRAPIPRIGECDHRLRQVTVARADGGEAGAGPFEGRVADGPFDGGDGQTLSAVGGRAFARGIWPP